MRHARWMIPFAVMAAVLTGTVAAEDPADRMMELGDYGLKMTLPANECWRFGKAGDIYKDSVATMMRYDSAKPDEKKDFPICRVAVRIYEWDKNYLFGPTKQAAKGDDTKALSRAFYISLFSENYKEARGHKELEKLKFKKVDKVNGFEVHGLSKEYKIPTYMKCLFFKAKKHTIMLFIQCFKDSEKKVAAEIQEVCDGLEVVKPR